MSVGSIVRLLGAKFRNRLGNELRISSVHIFEFAQVVRCQLKSQVLSSEHVSDVYLGVLQECLSNFVHRHNLQYRDAQPLYCPLYHICAPLLLFDCKCLIN